MKPDKRVRERMGFGEEPISEVVEGWSDGEDQALKSARTLFEGDSENIKLRTDLSDDEIRLIAKIGYYHKLVGIPELDGIVTEYMKLKVSRNRKSREEFVKTASSMSEKSKGFMGGLFNRS